MQLALINHANIGSPGIRLYCNRHNNRRYLQYDRRFWFSEQSRDREGKTTKTFQFSIFFRFPTSNERRTKSPLFIVGTQQQQQAAARTCAGVLGCRSSRAGGELCIGSAWRSAHAPLLCGLPLASFVISTSMRSNCSFVENTERKASYSIDHRHVPACADNSNTAHEEDSYRLLGQRIVAARLDGL